MNDTKTLFSNRAAAWDTNLKKQDPAIAVMLALSGTKPGGRILDVGCGTGVLIPFLLDYGPTEILGIDFAPGMIEVAQKKQADSRVRFLCADFLDFTDEDPWDICFFYNSFLHFPDSKLAVKHAASLLPVGGRLTICHPAGSKEKTGGMMVPPLPAQSLIHLTRPLFHLDAIVENEEMTLLSGYRLDRKL